MDTLLAKIYRHYPRGLAREDPRYRRSEEYKRLNAVLAACAVSMGESRPEVLASLAPTPVDDDVKEVIEKLQAWPQFIERLDREFADCVPLNTAVPGWDPCYSYGLAHPGFAIGDSRCNSVVCLLSALEPVYALYASHTDRDKQDGWIRYSQFPEDYREREARLAALIEETFQFSRLPEATLLLPIPDIEPFSSHLYMGQARLIDCLFTSHRE